MDSRDIEIEFEKRKKNTTENDLKIVLDNEDKIIKKSERGALAKFLKDIELMLNLVEDYWHGHYRDISWKTITSVVATLLYVFLPFDLIPDFIPVLGLTDDAAMVALCLRLLSNELEKYKQFKIEQEKLKSKTIEGL